MTVACSAPTQESFKPLQPPNHPVEPVQSPVTIAQTSTSFAPPNPTTHIIEIEDSPVPPSESSPSPASNTASPSLTSGLTHPALAQYQTHEISNAFLGSAAASMSEAQRSPAPTDEFKTCNVYINGLPPNFPEDQLLAMTQEFGEVVSVRTFTRHVSDRPS